MRSVGSIIYFFSIQTKFVGQCLSSTEFKLFTIYAIIFDIFPTDERAMLLPAPATLDEILRPNIVPHFISLFLDRPVALCLQPLAKSDP